MSTARRVLFGRRFWIYFVLPQVVFGVLAVLTDASDLIPILSVALVALSFGVCVAFLPAALTFFSGTGAMDRADALSIGIFATWFGSALSGSWGVAWRYAGEPLWLANNDFVSYFRYMAVCGAILHLAAPGAITDRIPPSRWVKIGAIVAVSIFGTFLVGLCLHLIADDIIDLR